MRAIFYFLITNIAVLLLVSIVFGLLTSTYGNEDLFGGLYGLLLMCMVFGMLGSFVSLMMSKPIAKWSSGTKMIKEPATSEERWLVETVNELADAEGIGRPDVGIFPAPDPNAFATGWRKNKALVAVSAGLLRSMNRNEVKAVIGHEIAHISNGDMLILTLIQGVLNTFVMFFARIFGFIVDAALRRDRESSGVGIGYWVGMIVAEIALGLLASMVVFSFSRRREFKADRKGANLTTYDDMIGALKRLQAATALSAGSSLPDSMKAMGISSGKKAGRMNLFSTHPPLELRIQALEEAKRNG